MEIDEETIFLALIQIEQMNAGCPVECEENPLSCDKNFEEMPRECMDYCRDELMRDHLKETEDDDCGCVCYR